MHAIEIVIVFTVNTEESDDMSTVTVKLVIPNMKVQKKLLGSAKPKPGEAEVSVKFDSW